MKYVRSKTTTPSPKKRVYKTKTQSGDREVIFKGEPKSLLAMEHFSQIAEKLKAFQMKAIKEMEAIAEEYEVLLEIDIIFDLKAKSKIKE